MGKLNVYIISKQLEKKDNRIEIKLVFIPNRCYLELNKEEIKKSELKYFKLIADNLGFQEFSTDTLEITNTDLISQITQEIKKIKEFLLNEEKKLFLKDFERDLKHLDVESEKKRRN